MARRKEIAVYRRTYATVKDWRFVNEVALEKVRVMARAEGYAMVRHRGAVPIVVSEKDLEAPEIDK